METAWRTCVNSVAHSCHVRRGNERALIHVLHDTALIVLVGHCHLRGCILGYADACWKQERTLQLQDVSVEMHTLYPEGEAGSATSSLSTCATGQGCFGISEAYTLPLDGYSVKVLHALEDEAIQAAAYIHKNSLYLVTSGMVTGALVSP